MHVKVCDLRKLKSVDATLEHSVSDTVYLLSSIIAFSPFKAHSPKDEFVSIFIWCCLCLEALQAITKPDLQGAIFKKKKNKRFTFI